jgi:hypothetical protein
MSTHKVALAGLLLATLGAAGVAFAQSGCPALDFHSSITSRFPDARDACLGIEMRDGRQYAHFQGEIVRVSGNRVRMRFQLPDGTFSDTYAFDVSPDARVSIEGRDYRWRDLERGQPLDIYLPPDRWQFHVPESERFEVSRTVAVFTPLRQEESTGGEMLPSTASPLPLIGFAGGVLSVLGVSLLALRRRLSK